VVQNGLPGPAIPGSERLALPENRGFAGGMNAGVQRAAEQGCDRFLLLNNDAVLEPGCLERLAGALDDASLAAVGPLILRAADGRVESRGIDVDARLGRVRLLGHGSEPPPEAAVTEAPALSGAVMMISRLAFERVGALDEDYFLSFEDVDWCLRARRAGFRLAVRLDARARHEGSLTQGRRSPERLYYAARNHVRLVERHGLIAGVPSRLRPLVVLALGVAHALRQRDVGRAQAAAAVIAGWRDGLRGRVGARPA
jgi:GT2 family glycosyltransferase